jgi:adenosylmethionine-8-amino-7-oxononanoate aminotransferase
VLARRAIVETLAAGSGSFHHAQTYSHHPAACAAGLATLRILAREKLVERVALMESALRAELDRLRAYAAVGDVRGRGFLFAIEFVADRESRRPFDRAERFAERFAERAFAHGLVVWPNAGSIGGREGDLAMIAPPFTLAEEEISLLGEKLAATLEEMR